MALPCSGYVRVLIVLLSIWALSGCASIRVTEPGRTATEQFLLTEAAQRAVDQLSADALRDRVVFVDDRYLQNTRDMQTETQYAIAAIRERLLMSGVRLANIRDDAQVIVEIRTGGIGIDRSEFLLGIPAFVIPATVTADSGVPLVSPELAIIKRLNQRGYGSVALVAYWRDTGELLTQSGPFVGRTYREDYWFFGFGPRTMGNIPPAQDTDE